MLRCPVGPQQTVQDAACRVRKRLRRQDRNEALALSQSASAAANPSTAAASLGDVAQAAPARGSRGGRATKVRRCCSPASQQAAAHPAQLKAVPLPGIEAGGSSGVHAPGMAEPEVGPTSQQAATDPAQLEAAANNTPRVCAFELATAGPSAAIAEQCPGSASGSAGSSRQQQLPAEGVDSEPGSPGPPAEQAFGNCGALAEQPLSGSTPITGQDTEQGESPCSNRQPNAACTQLGRLTAQQQVQEPGAAPAPLGKAGGTQHGCTELTQGLSANRDEAEAAGRAEETSGRPLAAGWLHSGVQAGTPPAQGVRHNRRVNPSGHPYASYLQFGVCLAQIMWPTWQYRLLAVCSAV